MLSVLSEPALGRDSPLGFFLCVVFGLVFVCLEAVSCKESVVVFKCKRSFVFPPY